jgi:peptidoglycan lytic transglycosylase B
MVRPWIATLAVIGALGVRAVGGQAPAAPKPDADGFAAWLDGVRAEAVARGIPEAVVADALGDLTEPEPAVVERDRSQPETVQTLEQYLRARVTARAQRLGTAMWARHRALLERVSRRYHVPARVILAVWGFESNFGRFSGVRPTIPSLVTLAWDPRRPALFRRELFDALEILSRGDIDLPRMRGSWAGAMGQTQFMPSSYLAFAEDFDGDGRRDIWDSDADIFASIAHYLGANGWHDGERWGREVVVPRAAARRVDAVPLRQGSCAAERTMSEPRPLAEWQAMGVRLPGGRDLPRSATLDASLVSGASRRFLVYRNYDALLEYNCAHPYAIGVGLLSDALQAP